MTVKNGIRQIIDGVEKSDTEAINLNDLLDVTITSVADNQFIQFDTGSGLWKNETITLGDPDQNLWATVSSDSGSTTANTTTDTITIAGGTGISTAVSGDTLTITNTASGDVTAASNLGDNLLIRGDGSVKGVQNSGITISDTDVMTGIGGMTAAGLIDFSAAGAFLITASTSPSVAGIGQIAVDLDGVITDYDDAQIVFSDGSSEFTVISVRTSELTTTDNDVIVYSTAGNRFIMQAQAGGGDVSAAANLTDNAIIRGDGGAKGVQDSSILIDDSDNVTGMGTLNGIIIPVAVSQTFMLNLLEDTTPQLGGLLDTNGNNISIDNTGAIEDDSGNEYLVFRKLASSVNFIQISNAAAGNEPGFAAIGTDTDIDIIFVPKGAGNIQLSGLKYPAADGTVNQVIETDGSGNLSFVTHTAGKDYTEKFVTFSASGAGAFEDKDLSGGSFNVPANAICEILIQNDEMNAENQGGVRANGSSLSRLVDLQEGEAGGVSAVIMTVKADADSIIEIFSEDTTELTFALIGFWS